MNKHFPTNLKRHVKRKHREHFDEIAATEEQNEALEAAENPLKGEWNQTS